MYALEQSVIATPIGPTIVVTSGPSINQVSLGRDPGFPTGHSILLRSAVEQLEEWFAGERRDFSLPLTAPTTARGVALRAGLIAVGYGETISYGGLAQLLKSSARAIGQLCARNPFPIIVPCHRVLAAGGKLGDYSAGEGPETKAWLLAHERRHTDGDPLF